VDPTVPGYTDFIVITLAAEANLHTPADDSVDKVDSVNKVGPR